MKACRYGIVFFGLGLSMTGLGHHNVEALLLLVRDLNDHTRFFARRMRVPGDVTGADTVLTWQTGYPFSVNLSRGYPRYNPGEFSANEMLERGDVDACLLVGSEGVGRFSAAAVGPPAADSDHRAGLSHGRVADPAHGSLHHGGLRRSPARHGLPHGRSAHPAAAVPVRATIRATTRCWARIEERVAQG